ncbi:MAG: TRAP transporter substrate-binding protein [Acetobacteraceae bacterium]|jgi:tripartite ATP-independent transporter DctP family solute receptor|nr:TRAP transporter substrate-binding protein [Acetobacteraceae bacterium]
MTSLTRRGLVAGALALPAIRAANAQRATVLRIAHALPQTHTYQLWAEQFRDALKASVGERIDVRIFPNAQLGRETEYLEGMKLGTIDGSILGRHGQIDGRLDVLNMPMIYRDDAHLDAVLRSGGAVQQRIDGIIFEKGYKCLGWGELGFRHVTTRAEPVRRAADMRGLDIRVPNVEPWLFAFRQWGANPTPLDFAELYAALQQGVVKAQENPPELIFSAKFFEVQKFLNLTSHANIPCQFLLGRTVWERLPRELHAPIEAAATRARDAQVKAAREANEKTIAELEKAGMTVVRDVDRASFEPGAVATFARYEDRLGADLIRAVREAKA